MAVPKINNFEFKKVKILDVEILADGVKKISFENNFSQRGKPGQFAIVAIFDKKSNCFRSYSVLQKNAEKFLEICVKKIPDGRGSTFLHSKKTGENLHIFFPMGYFGFPENLSKNLVFLATGTGIVPILDLLEALPPDFPESVKIFFGVRHEKDLFFEQRILAAAKNFKNKKIILTLSQPNENWRGQKGRITKFVEAENFAKNSQFFLCGSGAMISSLQKILAQKKMPRKNIFFENFNE